jgi:hypothetical protein
MSGSLSFPSRVSLPCRAGMISILFVRMLKSPQIFDTGLEKRANFDRLERATRAVVDPGVSF